MKIWGIYFSIFCKKGTPLSANERTVVEREVCASAGAAGEGGGRVTWVEKSGGKKDLRAGSRDAHTLLIYTEGEPREHDGYGEQGGDVGGHERGDAMRASDAVSVFLRGLRLAVYNVCEHSQCLLRASSTPRVSLGLSREEGNSVCSDEKFSQMGEGGTQRSGAETFLAFYAVFAARARKRTPTWSQTLRRPRPRTRVHRRDHWISLVSAPVHSFLIIAIRSQGFFFFFFVFLRRRLTWLVTLNNWSSSYQSVLFFNNVLVVVFLVDYAWQFR